MNPLEVAKYNYCELDVSEVNLWVANRRRANIMVKDGIRADFSQLSIVENSPIGLSTEICSLLQPLCVYLLPNSDA